MKRVVLDRFAALQYCASGSVREWAGSESPEAFVIFSSEYAALYAAASRPGKQRACGKLHEVAYLMGERCDCLSGSIPFLSTSFLRSVVPVPLRVLAAAPETLDLRRRLRAAMPELAELEAGFLANLAWDPAPVVGCSKVTSGTFNSFIRKSDVSWIELNHEYCVSPR